MSIYTRIAMACFVGAGLIIVMVLSMSTSFAQTPEPTATPTVTPSATPTPSPAPVYTPTTCDADFETCYGDSFGKFLLLFFALLIVIVTGATQRVMLAIMFLFFALLSMPLDVFGMWFFIATLGFSLADLYLGLAKKSSSK